MVFPYTGGRYPIEQLRGDVERLLSGFLSNVTESGWPLAGRGRPAVNVWEDRDAVYAELEVPGVKSDVALLESFAAEMFAKRGTYGWNHTWAGDAYHVALYAHLQPQVVFDESIIEHGLEGFRVLLMPDCDVLTEAVAGRVKEFQAAGGVVVGDERLAPAVTPDVRLQAYTRTKRAREDKAALLSLAAELRTQLQPRYRRYVVTSNPEVIPYRRRAGTTDYVFLVNDRREYGQYVGHHGLVMENGLPSEAVLSIDRVDGFVYDLVNSRPVAARREKGHLAVDVHLGPCDGRVYMVTARGIDGVRIRATFAGRIGNPPFVGRIGNPSHRDEVALGGKVDCVVEVVDAEGRPVDAVVPLEVTIRDAEGRAAEFSGYYGAAGGTAKITLDVARNDPFGVWQIEARELASGKTAVHSFRVLGPEPWPPSPKGDRKSTRLNSSHIPLSRMPSSA